VELILYLGDHVFVWIERAGHVGGHRDEHKHQRGVEKSFYAFVEHVLIS